ncbi:MAG: glycoside hydrolase family 1 protein [Deltaproteobacteria bacterium]|nr:glycoside hydrolase family 1 protein [Deltaproteobacteria bacterium]
MAWLVAALVLVASLGFNLWWSLRRTVPASRVEERPGATFPTGFLWGAGEDAYQHEGNSFNNDWSRWERSSPPPIDRGAVQERGSDFWERWQGDLALAAQDHHNAHRIGLEWSRIEPSPGVYDHAALARYRDMLRTMKEQHRFSTFVNLWHFTLPLWAADDGGWENPRLMERWRAYVQLCGRELGPWVDWWSTMIDSQIYALTGYLIAEIPPCVSDAPRALRVYRTMIDAHAVAYRALKEATRAPDGGDAKVGQIYFFFDVFRRGFLVDVPIRGVFERVFNWALLDALSTGNIDVFLPPTHRLRAHDPACAHTLDWIGVNYFTRAVTSFSPLAPGLISAARQTPWTTSDLDWEIFPEGLHRTLTRVQARYPGVPLFVTECGIADADDSRRPRFIVDHVAWTHRAIEEGVDVRGFFYWSMTDNWEWKRGPWPRFGLYEVDYATGERRARASAALFAAIARDNALPAVLPPAVLRVQRESRMPPDLDPARRQK